MPSIMANHRTDDAWRKTALEAYNHITKGQGTHHAKVAWLHQQLLGIAEENFNAGKKAGDDAGAEEKAAAAAELNEVIAKATADAAEKAMEQLTSVLTDTDLKVASEVMDFPQLKRFALECQRLRTRVALLEKPVTEPDLEEAIKLADLCALDPTSLEDSGPELTATVRKLAGEVQKLRRAINPDARDDDRG